MALATSAWRESFGALAPHPGLELADQGSRVLAAVGEPVGGGAAVDLALVGEDRVDPADRLDGERCRRRLAGSGEVGELEEASAGHGPSRALR